MEKETGLGESPLMEYTLMHKKIPVVDIILDETGYIAKINDIYDIRHLPVGINTNTAGIDRKSLNDWWESRSIPASRDGIREALDKLYVSDTKQLIDKCFGLTCCNKLGIPGVQSALDKMLGFAPIYDSGTSLWYNTPFVGEKKS